MRQVPLPNKGCFTSSYPIAQWQQVPCTTAPARPYPPAHGLRGNIVGNGSDVSAQVSGTISVSTGSFDSVTGVTSETGQVDGSGGQVANTFSLQLNTNFFSGSPACNGAAVPANCLAWEQFVYSNAGSAFIQYWLIDYNAACPSGWFAYSVDCYRNGANGVSVPSQVIANLVNLSLTGEANVSGGMDEIIMSTGSNLYSAQNPANIVDLYQGWTSSEFNIVGDCCSSEANFNLGSAIVVRTGVDDGSPDAPSCLGQGFTGETNNLNFATAPSPQPETLPATVFAESTSGTASQPCDSATDVAGSGTYAISVSASPAAGGSVSGSGSFASGSSQTVIANASTGYHFVDWTEGASVVSTSASYTFTLAANRTLVAHFAVSNYAISLSAAPAADGTVSGGGSHAYGTTATANATPKSGFAFTAWTESATTVSNSASYSFTVTGNRALVAHFVPKYTISVSASPAAGGAVLGGGSFASGSSDTVVATPHVGYVFSKWTQGVNTVSTSASYTFTVSANRTFVANFIATNYTVSVSASPAADGTVSGGGSFPAQSSHSVSAAPKSGFRFLAWLEQNVEQTAAKVYTFTLTHSRTLVAKFAPNHVARNDLLVARGSTGLWEYRDNHTWLKINAGSASQVAAGDLDGDGKDEAIAGFPTGLWADYKTGWLKLSAQVPTHIAVGDLDNDGRDDIVAAFGPSGVFERMNNAGGFAKIRAASVDAIAVGDLNGDGKDEVIIADPSGVWVRYGNAGSFVRIDPQEALHLAVGDLNGNGKDDMVADFAGQGLYEYLDNSGSWARIDINPTTGIAVGDLNGDKKGDVMVGRSGNGVWEHVGAAWSKVAAVTPIRIVAGDLDNSGKVEAIADFAGYGLRVRYNNAGAFVRLLPAVSQGIAVGGFN